MEFTALIAQNIYLASRNSLMSNYETYFTDNLSKKIDLLLQVLLRRHQYLRIIICLNRLFCAPIVSQDPVVGQ